VRERRTGAGENEDGRGENEDGSGENEAKRRENEEESTKSNGTLKIQWTIPVSFEMTMSVCLSCSEPKALALIPGLSAS